MRRRLPRQRQLPQVAAEVVLLLARALLAVDAAVLALKVQRRAADVAELLREVLRAVDAVVAAVKADVAAAPQRLPQHRAKLPTAYMWSALDIRSWLLSSKITLCWWKRRRTGSQIWLLR